MRAFISYAHEPDDRRFASWLYDKLKEKDSVLDPLIDRKNLALGPPWRESLPVLIRGCDILLFVRSRFSLSSPYCRFEVEVADHHALLIAVLDIEADTPPYEYTDRYSSIDFSQGRELGLATLHDRVRQWQSPEGQDQLKTYRLYRAQDRKLRGRSGTSARPGGEAGETRGDPWPIRIHGHERPRQDLRGFLASDNEGIIVVSGPEGIGKSAIVRSELAELESIDGPAIHYHVARPGRMLGAMILESVITNPTRARERDGSEGVYLPLDIDELLDLARDTDAVLVIDSFENLVDRRGTGLLDLELEEVLERISRLPSHRLKVVVVTRELPRPRDRSNWLLAARHVRVDNGLDPESFGRLLQDLDRRSDLVPPTTPDTLIADACRLLHGRPRLAEFVYARASRSFDTIYEVVTELEAIDPSGTAEYVFDEFIAALDGHARIVLEALAALGTPVDEATIGHMIVEAATITLETRRLNNILRWLVSRNAVSTAAGLFYLQEADRQRVLRWMPLEDDDTRDTPRRGRWTLLTTAADVLWRRRPERPGGADEFDHPIAAINALISAGEYEDAAKRIDEIDRHLVRWSRSSLLLQQRLRLRGRLPRDFLEFVNDTAVGEIYLENGLYREALMILLRAKTLAASIPSEELTWATNVNLGTALMRVGRTKDALAWYQQALAVAETRPDPAEQVLALEGIANCHRRWGDFDAAFDHLHRALTHAGHDTRFRLNLRLARWYSMEGDPRAQEHLAAVAEEKAGDRARAAYLDELGDQLLTEGDVEAALARATEAEIIARRLGDPILLQRTRTTLAFASLQAGALKEARQWAVLAARDRPGGRNLLVLALRALTALREGDRFSAREDFSLLREEAADRIRQDPRDFAAEGFLGLALCGRHVCADEPLKHAVRSLSRYAHPASKNDQAATRRIPAQLTARLRILLTCLADCAHPPGKLDQALQALEV
ncbi:tetratricopeptide repeat protein [Micromonospora tulbaghiae]|uniref:Tetratricopeptide repeat protein n=1 Tax=Micromonospora tulbaghiae TaxID=479978 RepID=A0AAW4JBA3_9ACTN|nr:tetratricopeptide repeat protein [Micromonospora tulbaghiae]MBO4139113.1 tetratricopeptide repeat protein [Micromonospora tulbaghiae]